MKNLICLIALCALSVTGSSCYSQPTKKSLSDDHNIAFALVVKNSTDYDVNIALQSTDGIGEARPVPPTKMIPSHTTGSLCMTGVALSPVGKKSITYNIYTIKDGKISNSLLHIIGMDYFESFYPGAMSYRVSKHDGRSFFGAIMYNGGDMKGEVQSTTFKAYEVFGGKSIIEITMTDDKCVAISNEAASEI